MEHRPTRQLRLGKVAIGGGAPVSVQSMTNTKTGDIAATVSQIRRLAAAGCDIVRLAVPDMAAAHALADIKAAVGDIPLVADIHFDYRLALAAIERGVDGLRLNPGNIGDREQVAAVVLAAKKRAIPIRIGVNAGSLDKTLLAKYGGHATAEAMVESALGHVAILAEHGFDAIKISLKANDVPMTIKAYQLISAAVDFPLHLGITEAGTISSGIIKSAVGIGALLAQGIGDTIRVSLTGDPVEEIRVANEILKSLGMKEFGPTLVSCPTCGRCEIDLVAVAAAVEDRLKAVKKPLKVAVMGCIVNGPGEAKEADIGIAGGRGQGLLFKKGEIIARVPEDQLITTLIAEIDKLAKEE
jgi:(E)-4-hydroxy-3-methylbut-2-enyl-diphosphate synthase